MNIKSGLRDNIVIFGMVFVFHYWKPSSYTILVSRKKYGIVDIFFIHILIPSSMKFIPHFF